VYAARHTGHSAFSLGLANPTNRLISMVSLNILVGRFSVFEDYTSKNQSKLPTCFFSDEVKFNTHQGDCKYPVNITEKYRRLSCFKIVATHVVIMHCCNKGDQAGDKDRCPPFLVNIRHFKKEKNAGGHHGHCTYKKGEGNIVGVCNRMYLQEVLEHGLKFLMN